MTSIRKLLCFVMSAALMAFALPGLGAPPPNKLYDLVMCVGEFAPITTDPTGRTCNVTQTPGQETQLRARVFNKSPARSAAPIRSLHLFPSDVVIWTFDSDSVTVEDNTGNFTIDATSQDIFISNLAPVNSNGWVTVVFNTDQFSCGDLHFDVEPWTGSTPGSGQLLEPVLGYVPPKASVACDSVACNVKFTVEAEPGVCANSTDPDCMGGIRGPTNSDGTTDAAACAPVYTYVTNKSFLYPDISSSLLFAWLTITGDHNPVAVFAYKVNVQSVAEPVWQVGWLPDLQAPVSIVTPYCNGHLSAPWTDTFPDPPSGVLAILPKNLGVAAEVKVNANKVEVAPIAPVPPIGSYIVIETEVMQITGSNSNSWFVDRPAPVFHSAGKFVVSTPFEPLVNDYTGTAYSLGQGFPPYTLLSQTKMCMATQPQFDSTTETWSAWFIDNGDGLISWR